MERNPAFAAAYARSEESRRLRVSTRDRAWAGRDGKQEEEKPGRRTNNGGAKTLNILLQQQQEHAAAMQQLIAVEYLKGEAYLIVNNLELTDANYQIAIDEPKKRYDKNRL